MRLRLLALLLLAPAVHAAVVLNATLEEMAVASDFVLRGTVGQQQSRWDDEGRRIYTYTELRVEDALKGDASGSVLIRQPGGLVNGIGQHVSGAARFTEGEEVVVFLQRARNDRSVLLPLGMAAGKISVDPAGLGGPRAYRKLDGLALYENGPDTPTLRSLDREDLGNLAALLTRLRKAIAAGGGR